MTILCLLQSSPLLKAKLKLKQFTSSTAENWLAKTDPWFYDRLLFGQSLITIVISLATITVTGSILFKIDEVITVTGQLTSVSGSPM